MATQTPHILLVDDCRVDCVVASFTLNSFNIRVTIAGDAMEALEFLEVNNNGVDLILTEYCIPDMTGYDLLREVKESPKLKHIPVVITCTDVIPERIIECIEGGAEEYMIKPLKVSDVPRILSYM
ncbi:two-component response regulator ORR12-like [Miscanthus floridulus]|uniref:two-component response regulator ORR12-like n=1 Tax=Miscanthus floridulus TaxID=154761 RepID=UPI00345B3F42